MYSGSRRATKVEKRIRDQCGKTHLETYANDPGGVSYVVRGFNTHSGGKRVRKQDGDGSAKGLETCHVICP